MSDISKKNLFRPSLSTTTVTLLVALYIVLVDNRLFWDSFIARIGLDSVGHWVFLLSVGVAFVLLLNILLSLFSFHPVFKPFLILLLLTAATISYFSDTFGIVIDQSMIHNILETDVHEAAELLTWPLFRNLLLFGFLPAAFFVLIENRQRFRKKHALTRIGVVIGSLILLLGLGLMSYKQFILFGRDNRDLRVYVNPSYPVYSLYKVVKEIYSTHAAEPLRRVATDAVRHPGPKSVVVLVLGETARARQFAFNGYERNTNPRLANLDGVNFFDVQACGTSTAESVPCLFSSLDRKNFSRDKASEQENLLDILQRVGVRVLWLDNNSGSKGVAERVRYEDLSREDDADLCGGNNCFDEILLRDLDGRLTESTGDMLIVLHMNGSHGPSYYKRTPPGFKAFLPECSMDNLQDCPRQSVVNAYDNTILYTDHVLADLIEMLQTQDFATAMLYVSDHGESLGEDGLYLHGLPYALAPEEQTQVPMIFWGSDSFLKNKEIDLAALADRRNQSHDAIFHSVLGLFGIESRIYNPDLDLFAHRDTHGN